ADGSAAVAVSDIAASGEPTPEGPMPYSATPGDGDELEAVETEETVDEAEEEEAEIEEAQAEAEALLDAEARGDGSVDAHAEVRAPAGTAGYTQRAQRPSFDRRFPRGRRSGRGRFRRQEPRALPQINDLLKEG